MIGSWGEILIDELRKEVELEPRGQTFALVLINVMNAERNVGCMWKRF
jgi:hypothetical protein